MCDLISGLQMITSISRLFSNVEHVQQNTVLPLRLTAYGEDCVPPNVSLTLALALTSTCR